jgi:hypothetical protein
MRAIHNFGVSPIFEHKSRAPKHGFWLMRGAQPATNAGARLFAGKPDSGVPHHPAKGVRKSILSLLNSNVLPDEYFQNLPSSLPEKSTHLSCECVDKLIRSLRWITSATNILNSIQADSKRAISSRVRAKSSSVGGVSLDSRGSG